ncbi:DNA-binding transcriptional regulator, MerR family [Dyadobacter sp. SG02]|uniref:MerR family transcriptional regulator n=1 Tax=Dyadobacter sp. SG02 TaxID=1855291 RepID=UPI0008CAA9A4|nr:MerR family transcriptional regulator [Dyadobacter sp. SG02]SEJ54572.1 DNA-binding transcriptional regulator, MerR family [Dyadobacter sp. SG02]
MSIYSIRDLERITSTRAHTIRIWEQRYGLLEPERTGTNIRFYNDDHVKKLLNVCTLLNRGMKISHISQLSNAQIREEIDRIIAGSLQADEQVEAWINEAVSAIAAYDAPRFHKLFADALDRLGMVATYEKILYPLLVRTGLMWTKDALLPAQEHFLSNLIRQKLFTAIDALPLPETSAQKWLLFLHEGEEHEIGLLFAHYLLTRAGQRAVYLGARVPYADLQAAVSNIAPTHIYTFFVSNQPDNLAPELLGQLAQDFPECRICFSGGTDGPENEPRMIHIGSIDELLDTIGTDATHTNP